MRNIVALGIDVGGTSIKAVLAGQDSVIADAQSDAYSMPDEATLRSSLRQVCGQLPGSAISTVGLCVPGMLNEKATRVERALNLPGLSAFELADWVRSAVPSVERICVTTDAHAAAYGHWSLDRLPGRSLTLVIGTGVGACVLDAGVRCLVTGQSSGHIGQIDVGRCGSDSDAYSSDGSRNTLESHIGLHALMRRYGDDPVTAMLHAPLHDPPWQALIRAVRIAHAIYRPERVVLLGGIGARLSPRIWELQSEISRELTSVARLGWTLESGSPQMGALGAARYALSDLR